MHVPGNAADVTPISTPRSGDGALVGAIRDGAVVQYMRDNAAQLAGIIISVKADGAADGDILHGSIHDFCKQSALPRVGALQVAHGMTLSVEVSIESIRGTDGCPFAVVEVDVGSELECVASKYILLLCQPCQLGGGGDAHLSGRAGVVVCGLGDGGAVPHERIDIIVSVRCLLPVVAHRYGELGATARHG